MANEFQQPENGTWEQLSLPGFEPKPPAAETIKKQLPIVQFRMDFLRSPEEALLKWNASGGYEKWFRFHFDELVKIVAEKTGADPEQIANKETRTPEQEQLLKEAAAAQEIARIDAFFESSFMDAINTLEPLQGVYKDPGEIDFYTDNDRFNPDSQYISVKEQAVLYYFALHDGELSPTDRKPLTEDQKEELRGIYTRLDKFFLERTGGGSYDPDGPVILLEFIERENPTPETAESIAAKLPLVQGIKPTTHTMPNNALMNTLQQKEAINAGPFDMVVANATGRRKEITAYTMVELDPGETDIKITDAHLSEYERQVSDAVISLWIEASKEKLPPIFTPDMIFRAMPGGSDKASPQQKGAITKAIERFRRLHITVDATDEMRKRGVIGSSATFKLDNFYLSATHAEYKIKNGGQTVNAYKIDTEPIILTYCNMTKQLLTTPAKYITIQKVKSDRASGELLPMTADRQAMTGYMLRRVLVMKRDENEAKDKKRQYDRRRAKDDSLKEKPLNAFRDKSRVILFDSIFSAAENVTADRKQTMRNRDFCFNVLDFWKVSGLIADYKKQEKARSITGIVIEF